MNSRVGTNAHALERQSGTLRQYLSNVFFVMTMGLMLTGTIALFISRSDASMTSLFHTTSYIDSSGKEKLTFVASGYWYFAAISELVLVVFLSWFGLASKLGTVTALVTFSVFAGLNGVTLAPVLYAYTAASITKVFFIAATMFGSCALWGHTTKTDLTRFGLFFLAVLVGLLVALIAGIFLQSSLYDLGVSSLAVLLFAALTAYDMQRLEQIYNDEGQTYTTGTIIFGALTLYLDFINMFIHLLRLFGVKKD